MPFGLDRIHIITFFATLSAPHQFGSKNGIEFMIRRMLVKKVGCVSSTGQCVL